MLEKGVCGWKMEGGQGGGRVNTRDEGEMGEGKEGRHGVREVNVKDGGSKGKKGVGESGKGRNGVKSAVRERREGIGKGRKDTLGGRKRKEDVGRGSQVEATSVHYFTSLLLLWGMRGKGSALLTSHSTHLGVIPHVPPRCDQNTRN